MSVFYIELENNSSDAIAPILILDITAGYHLQTLGQVEKPS
jgi:hypothetical protein